MASHDIMIPKYMWHIVSMQDPSFHGGHVAVAIVDASPGEERSWTK